MAETDIHCVVPGCSFSTGLRPQKVAIALLCNHNSVHLTPQHAPGVPAAARGPRLDRPKIDVGVSEEQWNVFQRRWSAFANGSGIDPNDSSSQLFQCSSDDLGNGLLKSDPDILSKPTIELLAAMKAMAVIAVATGVNRAELMLLHQERDEAFRSFAARVRGKAETCAYTVRCACAVSVDFTEIIVRDVLIAGIADTDIRREILGIGNILEQTVNNVITLVESKEMARNALPSSTAGISSFKRGLFVSPQSGRGQVGTCPECKTNFALFSEGARGWNTKPHRICQACYKAHRTKRSNEKPGNRTGTSESYKIGANLAQVSTLAMVKHRRKVNRRKPQATRDFTEIGQSSVRLPHHIFSKGQWRRARFLDHPTLQLEVTVLPSDYAAFRRQCPNISPSLITAIADTGAQSCLWSMSAFLAAGFSSSDLIPVTLDLSAANTSPIPVAGAVLLHLSVPSAKGNRPSCAAMVYVSSAARGFYLSWEVMMDLGIVSSNFPSLESPTLSPVTKQLDDGSPITHDCRDTVQRTFNAGCSSTIDDYASPCSCPVRTVVPKRPLTLPFDCTEANNPKMKTWLLDNFASSTFNTCPHCPLPCMSGPPVEIHLKEGVIPKAVHTPAPIPVHWQEKVHHDLLRDHALGVIERVPYGEAVKWCHRMVVTRKHDGSPRRTVDLSPLNKHCERETFASESPFHLARRVPGEAWKTVTDAWNGYHSVPLRESDRHLTTFITPFGRWRYTRAPQGFLSSGDGYNRRFDEILAEFERKERCVDDTIHHDSDLKEHWWRTIDYLILVGSSGVVLNPDKFQFAQRTVDFAGFRISMSTIEPLPKYIDAIRDFPTPTSTTDIRSWFGLVNQVTNYAKLREIMRPFKPFLSPKTPFTWSPDLESAFQTSKLAIVEAIRSGVEIFDPRRRTCLRPDWSKLGIGYFLSQKHCACTSTLPGCCDSGWKITLAGSRFLSPTEQRYAPIEGEALAVAWGLEQSRYFTQGCDDLIVVTDHKPLVKILGDRTLDEISNSRLFRLKQRTLPWYFEVAHLPGKTNTAADATSRHPSPSTYAELASIDMSSEMDYFERTMTAAICRDATSFTALSWERIVFETSRDPGMCRLMEAIEEGFPDHCRAADDTVSAFWVHRDSLCISDGAVMFQDRVVIPPSLRNEVLCTLHSAHQGVSSMQSRARSIVFWPGMSAAIQVTRDTCSTCNKSAPSQAATPPARASDMPATPFESIFADFCDYGGCHYLVVGDRLSGWVDIFRTPPGSPQAGSAGLISCLRHLFATFGVPETLSSDGGPEFTASATSDFLSRWGVFHRISSVSFPQSNGRAEVAVKKAKRTLMNNIGPAGSLDNDSLLRAMLQLRNTPDPDCNVSPAEVIFGRPIRDAFSFVNRREKFANPSIRPMWREAWSAKESAMCTRFTRTTEALTPHTRALPPLLVGARVYVQNQTGPNPNKWDRSGIVVEVGDHDQYLIKIDGSGRLSLRNRRFLRQYVAPSATIGDPLRQMATPSSQHKQLPVTAVPAILPSPPSAFRPLSATATTLPIPLTTPVGLPSESFLPAVASTPVDHTPYSPSQSPAASQSSPRQAPPSAEHVTASPTAIRPSRLRRPPPRYDPESGRWEPAVTFIP